eukprot:8492444-Pyramimonas_sp.AAC.1
MRADGKKDEGAHLGKQSEQPVLTESSLGARGWPWKASSGHPWGPRGGEGKRRLGSARNPWARQDGGHAA